MQVAGRLDAGKNPFHECHCQLPEHYRFARRLPRKAVSAQVRRVALLPDRADRLAPADDAEKRQKQAVNRDPAAIRTSESTIARNRASRRPAARAAAPATSDAPIASAPKDPRQPLARRRHRWKSRMSSHPCRSAAKRAAPGAERDGGGDRRWRRTVAEHEGGDDRHQRCRERRHSGVNVSSRAKNAGDSALTSTCAGRPSASQLSACAVAALSLAVNAPCSNSTRTIGSAEHDQAERRRQRQSDGEFEAAQFRMRNGSSIITANGSCHFRHQHRAHGDAHDAERQFDQAVGEIQPRYRRRRGRGDDGAGHHQQLRRAAGDHAGDRLAEKAAHFAVERNRAAAWRCCRRARPASDNCSSPAMPTVAAMISAASTASCRHASSAAIAAISATLNSSGENAVSAKRALRVQQRHHHRHRSGKGEIRQHQPGVVDGELQRLRCPQSPAPARR